MVLDGKRDEITEELCQQLLNTDEYICTLGVDGLSVVWVDSGTTFRIDEYDGAESIIDNSDLTLNA